MKILWVCNVAMPIISQHIGRGAAVGGGWMTGVANSFINEDDTSEIIVCFPEDAKGKVEGQIGAIKYYSFRRSSALKYDKNTEEDLFDIFSKEKPSLVHIWGSEFPHTLAAVNAAERTDLLNSTAISIQGLVSIYERHFSAALPHFALKKNTLRDFLKKDNILNQKKKFAKRGTFELEAIKKVKHVIGRTDWDKACVRLINPTAEYHFCNETLRDSFYQGKWSVENCEKHSIFVSQSNYPIKGFHLMLEAMAEIVRFYPDSCLYTTGRNVMNDKSWFSAQKRSYYENYIRKLIKRYRLENNVKFVGFLSEEKMKNRFIKSHVFVSPSSIENSPNSVGEAMLLGVPCISSDVGGVKNMLSHGVDGLIYPFDEPYVLAHYVCSLFESDEECLRLSNNAQEHARRTHSSSNNREALKAIYTNLSRKHS